MQRHDRNAETRLPGAERGRPDARGFGQRQYLDQVSVAEHSGVEHAQHALEDRQHVLALDLLCRRECHKSLDARIDGVVQAETVAEQ